MVKRLIACVFLVMGALEAGAQTFPSQLWYSGEVRLNDNTYLRGRVKYDLDHDVVQLDRDGRIETYSPQQVTSFNFKVTQRTRKGKEEAFSRVFYSLPYANHVGFKRLSFFEVVIEGKATLLAREYISTVTNNAGQRWGRARNLRGAGALNGPQRLPNTRRVLAHKMYLASLDGEIQELPNKRKELLNLFKDHGNAMKAFIKQERLKVEQLFDMARFFNHYNGLSNQQTKAH